MNMTCSNVSGLRINEGIKGHCKLTDFIWLQIWESTPCPGGTASSKSAARRLHMEDAVHTLRAHRAGVYNQRQPERVHGRER